MEFFLFVIINIEYETIYMRVSLTIYMAFFVIVYINIFLKKLFFSIGPVSRAARWQLKALRAPGPGLQVESCSKS